MGRLPTRVFGMGVAPALRTSVLDWCAGGLRFRGGRPGAARGGPCYDGYEFFPLDV